VTPADETFGQFSPNGRWVAYSSDESGRREVYVRGFSSDHVPAAAVGQWQISSDGGDKPRWAADGKELFYIASDGRMTVVPVKGDSAFGPGVPVPLFETRVAGFAPYDIAPDGRFLMNTMPGGDVGVVDQHCAELAGATEEVSPWRNGRRTVAALIGIIPTKMAFSPGTRLGPYEIISALGSGGMGDVYRARQMKIDSPGRMNGRRAL